MKNGFFSKLYNFDKQIGCLGVSEPVESKSGLLFEQGVLLDCHFGFFVNIIVNRIHPWAAINITLL